MARPIPWYRRLMKARKAMGLTFGGAVKLLEQEHKIKMHRGNLCKVEQGESDMPVTKFKAFCNIYEVSADWVLDLKD